MLRLSPAVRIFVATEPVDMRKAHNGLLAIVKNQWALDPYSGHLFVFLGKRLDRAKILYFDHGGFVLWYKRLEHGRFKLPRANLGQERISFDSSQLSMLLDGIDFSKVKRPKHWRPKRTSEDLRIDKSKPS